jgi:hypothetical protein
MSPFDEMAKIEGCVETMNKASPYCQTCDPR